MHRRWMRPARLVVAAAATTGLVLTAMPAFAGIANSPSSTWGANGRVKAIVSVGSVNIIGGSFSEVLDTSGHPFAAASLAQIDANSGIVNRGWTGSTNGDVYAMAVLGSTLYVGGDFTKVDGQNARNLAAINVSTGALVSTFKATANKPVDALTAVNGFVYAGGRFTSITDSTGTTARTFLAKLNATTGLVSQAWHPTPDLRVRVLTASGDGATVYAGGDFTMINGQTEHSTAAIQGADPGGLITSFRGVQTNGNQFAPVYGMDLVGSTLYLAVAGGGGACTAFNASTGARIWTKHTNGNLQAVVYIDGIVYCGGHFGGAGSFDGQERYHMASVNATAPYAVTTFAPHFNSALGVWAMATDNSHLFAGGDFTQISGLKRNHYAVWGVTP